MKRYFNVLAVVLYGRLSENPTEDDLDVLVQARAVSEALTRMGFDVYSFAFSSDTDFPEALLRLNPGLVFNLVESVDSIGARSYLAPALLEKLGIPYTGCPAKSIFLTTNKILTKRSLRRLGIPTPAWITAGDSAGFSPENTYIVKSVCEDASIGLSEKSVVQFGSRENARCFLKQLNANPQTKFFAETYIDGREFSVAILGEVGNPRLLPPLEMVFTGYDERHQAKIVDYKAKWHTDSFEYQNTNSALCTDLAPALLEAMCRISETCWNHFRLRGYARVDFRVDAHGQPWVLEINANPCITPGGSGFLKSAAATGLDFDGVITAIVRDSAKNILPMQQWEKRHLRWNRIRYSSETI